MVSCSNNFGGMSRGGNHMEIRELEASELDDLLALYEHLHEQDDPLPERKVITAVWQRIQTNDNLLYFGGFVDNQLACSCTLTLIPNLTRRCRPYGVIENVVTDAAFRGNGYGKAILRHALTVAWVRDSYKVMLLTGRLNEQTFRFYESVGFDRHLKQAFLAKPSTE